MFSVVRLDADAVIAHLERHVGAVISRSHRNCAVAGREFERVVDQVCNYASQRGSICINRLQSVAKLSLDGHTLILSQGKQLFNTRTSQRVEVDFFEIESARTCFVVKNVEQ